MCKKTLIVSVFILTFIIPQVSGQRKVDPGIFAGTSYYMGELNSIQHFVAPSVAVGPIIRYNFDMRNSVRVHAFYHGLSGSGEQFPSGGLQEFDAKFVDLALNWEFNWFPYKTTDRKYNKSPYIFAGIGYGLNLSNLASVNVTTPFGFGYKVNVGRWLSAGVEAGARKVWSDMLDGVQNPGFELSDEWNTLNAGLGNRDWYFFTGVFITYKIFKFWESCPTYD